MITLKKSLDMPKLKGEFSFEKNEFVEQNLLMSLDNNMTAHFNKFNLLSKGKDSNYLLSNSGYKDTHRKQGT